MRVYDSVLIANLRSRSSRSHRHNHVHRWEEACWGWCMAIRIMHQISTAHHCYFGPALQACQANHPQDTGAFGQFHQVSNTILFPQSASVLTCLSFCVRGLALKMLAVHYYQVKNQFWKLWHIMRSCKHEFHEFRYHKTYNLYNTCCCHSIQLYTEGLWLLRSNKLWLLVLSTASTATTANRNTFVLTVVLWTWSAAPFLLWLIDMAKEAFVFRSVTAVNLNGKTPIYTWFLWAGRDSSLHLSSLISVNLLLHPHRSGKSYNQQNV